MKLLFWNIRGFWAKGRRSQIIELIKKHHIDGVCFQETIKNKFTDRELHSLCGGMQFWWSWIPATGHSSGILIGINDFRGGKKWTFSHNVQLLDKISGASFDLVNVYGPVQEYRKGDFLQELRTLVEECQNAIIIGGDFNLVRSRQEKST